MKKITLGIMAVTMGLMVLSSCGKSPAENGTRAGELFCKLLSSESADEKQELNKEMKEIKNAIKDYNEEDQKTYTEAYEKAMEACE